MDRSASKHAVVFLLLDAKLLSLKHKESVSIVNNHTLIFTCGFMALFIIFMACALMALALLNLLSYGCPFTSHIRLRRTRPRPPLWPVPVWLGAAEAKMLNC